MDDPIAAAARARTLEALGALRARRAGFYREYLGIRLTFLSQSHCEAVMPAGPPTLGPDGFVAPGALASLADIALGSALRPSIGSAQRLATFGLTLQLLRAGPAEEIQAWAEAVSAAGQIGVARCRLSDEKGALLATATGSFALRGVAPAGVWQPPSRDGALERRAYPPIDPGELSESEQRLLGHVQSSVRPGDPDGPFGGYLGITWQERGAGRSSGNWRLGPHLWNRARQVHGGAMFGALAAAALACLPPGERPRMVEQHVQYLRAGHGEGLHLRAELMRRGRQLISTEAAVLDGSGQIVARALATLESGGETNRTAGG